MQRMLVGATVVGTLMLVSGCRGGESDKPPVHLIRNMDTQDKGKAYYKDTTGLFADGRVMRTPPEGTVARGQAHDDDVLSLGVGADGQPSAKYPTSIKVDDAVRARGKVRFLTYCAPCHGPLGDGKGKVGQAQGLLVPPPNLHDARIKEMPLGKIYAAIAQGVNAGNMPSYAAQITEKDRWAIVSYVVALQKEQDPNVQEEDRKAGAPLVAAAAASATFGEAVFKAKGCNACHSVDGSKLVGPSMKALWGKSEATDKGSVTVDEAYFKESLATPMAKIVTGFPPAMPPQVLTDIETQSLILYIQSLK